MNKEKIKTITLAISRGLSYFLSGISLLILVVSLFKLLTTKESFNLSTLNLLTGSFSIFLLSRIIFQLKPLVKAQALGNKSELRKIFIRTKIILIIFIIALIFYRMVSFIDILSLNNIYTFLEVYKSGWIEGVILSSLIVYFLISHIQSLEVKISRVKVELISSNSRFVLIGLLMFLLLFIASLKIPEDLSLMHPTLKDNRLSAYLSVVFYGLKISMMSIIPFSILYLLNDEYESKIKVLNVIILIGSIISGFMFLINLTYLIDPNIQMSPFLTIPLLFVSIIFLGVLIEFKENLIKSVDNRLYSEIL